jgi:hypothetical protein
MLQAMGEETMLHCKHSAAAMRSSGCRHRCSAFHEKPSIPRALLITGALGVIEPQVVAAFACACLHTYSWRACRWGQCLRVRDME